MARSQGEANPFRTSPDPGLYVARPATDEAARGIFVAACDEGVALPETGS